MEKIGSGYIKEQEIAQQGTRTSTNSADEQRNYLSEFFHYFLEGLITIKNKIVDGSTELYHYSLDEQQVESIHYNFDEKLESVTQIKAHTSDTPRTDQQFELKEITSFSTKDEDTRRVNSREEFVSALEKIKTNLEQGAKSTKKIDDVINYLKANSKVDERLDVIENAYVSYRLEAVLTDLKNESAEIETALTAPAISAPTNQKIAGNKYRHLQFAIALIQSLEDQAFIGWNHLANEKKIEALDEHYHPQFKVGYSRSITLDGSVGISAGSPINIKGATLEAQVSLTGAINVLWMLDDEGYIAIVKTAALGVSAEANADLLCAAKASASVKGDLTKGEYREVRSSREFVTYLLPDLVRDSKHRDDPRIAPYLSRSATLVHAMGDKGLSQDLELWAVTRKESDDIDRVKKESDLVSGHNDMLRSLSKSSIAPGLQPKVDKSEAIVRLQALAWIEEYVDIQNVYSIDELAEELGNLPKPTPIQAAALRHLEDYKKIKEAKVDKTKKTFTSQKIEVTSANAAKADLSAYSAKLDGSAGIGIGVNGVQNVVGVGASGSITRKHRVLEDFKSTAFGQLITGVFSQGDMTTINDLINQNTLSQEEENTIVGLINQDTLSPQDIPSIDALIKEIEKNSAKEKQEIIDLILKPSFSLSLSPNARDTRSEREKNSIKKMILASPMNSIEEKQKIINLIPDELMDKKDVDKLKEKIFGNEREPTDKEQELIALMARYLKSPTDRDRIKKLIPEHRMNLKVQVDKLLEPIIYDAMKKRESVIELLEKLLNVSDQKDESANLTFADNAKKKDQRIVDLLTALMTSNSPEKKEAFTKQLFDNSVKKNRIKKGISKQFHFFKKTLFDNWKKETDQIGLTQTGIELQKKSFDKDVSDEQFVAYFEDKKLPELTPELREKIVVGNGKFTDVNQWRNNLLKVRKNDPLSDENSRLFNECGFIKNSKLTETGRKLRSMAFNDKVSDEEFLAYAEKCKLWLELRTTVPEGPERTKQSTERWKRLQDYGLVTKKNTTDLSDGKVMFKFLKQDFKLYTDLHIRIAFRGYATPQDEESLAYFAERYGVNRHDTNVKEQVLHRMIIANAYLLSELKDKALKVDMLEFEQKLLSPVFEIDQDYLKRNACYQEDMDFEVIENIAKAEVNFTVVSVGCTFKFEAIQRERVHINQLRDGNYWDLNFTVSGQISDIKALISSITETVVQKYPPELAEKILADVASALSNVEPSASATREKAYLVRYFKPTAFGGNLPYKKLFNRVSIDKEFQIGIRGSIPTGLPVNLTLGLGYTNLSTDSEAEYFSANTFIYALMFGMHEYVVTSELQSSYDISKNDAWKLIKQQQRPYFSKVFQNYASELRTAKVERDSLSEEINAIEEEIMSNQNLSWSQKAAFKKAKEDFQKAVKMPLHKPVHYEAALASFEKLMHAYSPNWLDKRANSSHYKEGYLPKLEGTETSLSARIQQSKVQYAFIEEDKYKYESNLFPGLMPPNVGADLMHYL